MAGYIHLYTGNGKGKTTAALGLALRAVGAGKSVFIAQFVKGMHYAELDAIKRFPEIELKQYGLDCFIENQPTEKDILAARKGFAEVKTMILDNEFDMIILDEVCIALLLSFVRNGRIDNCPAKETGNDGNHSHRPVCTF